MPAQDSSAVPSSHVPMLPEAVRTPSMSKAASSPQREKYFASVRPPTSCAISAKAQLQDFASASSRPISPWTCCQLMRRPSMTTLPSQVKVRSRMSGTVSSAAAAVTSFIVEPGVYAARKQRLM